MVCPAHSFTKSPWRHRLGGLVDSFSSAIGPQS